MLNKKSIGKRLMEVCNKHTSKTNEINTLKNIVEIKQISKYEIHLIKNGMLFKKFYGDPIFIRPIVEAEALAIG